MSTPEELIAEIKRRIETYEAFLQQTTESLPLDPGMAVIRDSLETARRELQIWEQRRERRTPGA